MTPKPYVSTPEKKARSLRNYYANRERYLKKNKEWRQKNKERRQAQLKAWEERPDVVEKRKARRKEVYKENRESILRINKIWREENKEYRKEYRREYVQKNKVILYAKHSEYRRTNINAKLAARLRCRISYALRTAKAVKAGRTIKMLGCTYEQLRWHLQTGFKEGMSWENYGAWEIDHIRPCASYDLTDEAQQHACFHYTNLQPLWMVENRTKSYRYAPQVVEPI